MMIKQYLSVALPTSLRRLFDYLPPDVYDPVDIQPGLRILVPFQSRKLVGMIIGIKKESKIPVDKIKKAFAILDEQPLLPNDVYRLCQWASLYYHYSLGEVIASALPALLRKGKDIPKHIKPFPLFQKKADVHLLLNEAQKNAIHAIESAKNIFKVFLLEGVTGSGKTEVYLRAIQNILLEEKQVLVLVPEINLTPQTIERFRERFTVPMVVLHSSLSEKKRLEAWTAAKNGIVKIVIGTRSAVFTPFKSLGMIIIDEEHDISFKQQERFRYHARDLAILRANINTIPIVLGSATPSLESLLNAKRSRYQTLFLPERAGNATLPDYQIIDLRTNALKDGLSAPLLKLMKTHLDEDNQIILFLNRRGFAPVLYCTSCAWMMNCKRCEAHMVYHHKPNHMKCHHCDSTGTILMACPQCNNETLKPVGIGTQRLQQTLEKHFPDVPIIRMDKDTTSRKGKIEALLNTIQTQNKLILLGTQMLAKGHHFPRVTLVGLVDIDGGLFSADFRGAEQMGQLLLQVAGRAGRENKKGTVAIQTYHPNHPLLQLLMNESYNHFSQTLLAEREVNKLPPFSYFAMFRAESYKETEAKEFLLQIKSLCLKQNKNIAILGPAPAKIAKRKGLFCQHLLLKSENRVNLQKQLQIVLKKIEELNLPRKLKWILDVDPVEV